MKSPEATPEMLKDHLRFLNELCEISKHLDQEQKMSFYAALHDHGLLEVLQRTIAYSEMSMLSVEILLASIDTDGRQLRKYLLKNKEGGLLALLITRLHEDEDTGVKNVVTDLLRFLVDVDAADDSTDREQFLNMFYHHHLDRLLLPILNHPQERQSRTLSDATGILIRNLIDLVGFLLMHHGTRARTHIVNYQILSRMNPLISYVDKHVALAAVRNLRLVISLKDIVLNRIILKENLVDRVVQLFLANASRYNLINSACLDLFNQIKKDGHAPMIAHFTARYYEQLKDITYTDLFVQFKGISDDFRYQNAPGSFHGGHGGSGGLDMDALLNDDLPETPPLASFGLGGRHADRSSSSSRENEKFHSEMDEMEYFESGDDDLPNPSLEDNGAGTSLSDVGLAGNHGSSYASTSSFPKHHHGLTDIMGSSSASSSTHSTATPSMGSSSHGLVAKRHSAAPEVHVPEEALVESSPSANDHPSALTSSTLVNSSYRANSDLDDESAGQSFGSDSVSSSAPEHQPNETLITPNNTSSSHTTIEQPHSSSSSDSTLPVNSSTSSENMAQHILNEDLLPNDTVHKKRKSTSMEPSGIDENADVTPPNKRPKSAEDAVDTHS